MLGILDISLPVIYGEGKEKALRRLNREWKYRVEELGEPSVMPQQTLEKHSGRFWLSPLSSINGSIVPPISNNPITGHQSPPGSSVPSSPTRVDARLALDTLLNYLYQAPPDTVDQNEYLTILNLTDKLRVL